ncbi:MAG: hypothetical protein U0T74_13500 [Chitinophagales bacterium]
MENKTHLVAFIDILGFRRLIDNHFSGKDTKSLPVLTQALKNAEDYAIKYNQGYLKQFDIKFSFKQFSDCVSISMPFKQKQNHTTLTIWGAFISVVRVYQFILLDHNIPIRGGISIGGHFENDNMIFSDGLVKAYGLEKEKAIYPRIVLDKDILFLVKSILKEIPDQYPLFYKLYGQTIIKDWDGEFFLSPFGFIRDMQALEETYGKGTVKKLLDIGFQANRIDGEVPDNVMEELGDDKTAMTTILANVDNYLRENSNKEKAETILKYKWLQQFIIWNLTPKKSQIKFEYYFQP